ncbi:Ig-like domain-containing protein [Burkholderia sp. 572]|uniref:Ig-like domain-containing protein n=1 Tax=Burkholderia sp. 572 TaxID=3156414 RepID=UPI003394777B
MRPRIRRSDRHWHIGFLTEEDSMNRNVPDSIQNRQNNNGMNEVFSSSVVIRSVSDETAEHVTHIGDKAAELSVPQHQGEVPLGASAGAHDNRTTIGDASMDVQGMRMSGADSSSAAGEPVTAVRAPDPTSSDSFAGRIDGSVRGIGGTFELAALVGEGTPHADAAGSQARDLPVSIDFAYDEISASQDGAADGALRTGGTPRLSGTAPADTIVEFYDNGESIGSTRTNALGQWTFEPSQALASGLHALTAYIGGVPASEPFTLEVVVPAVNPLLVSIAYESVEQPFVDLTTDQHGGGHHVARIYGTAPQHAEIDVLDNGILLGSTRASAGGQWTLETNQPLTVGTHALTAYINGVPASQTLVVDTDAPTTIAQLASKAAMPVVIEFANDEAVTRLDGQSRSILAEHTAPRLAGKASAGAVVVLFDDDREIGRVLADRDGNWAFEPEVPLEYGMHTLTAVVDGIPSEPVAIEIAMPAALVPVTFDVSALGLSGLNGQASAGGQIDENTAPRLNGRAPSHSIVEIYDNDTLIGSAVADEDGHWTFEFDGPLSAGRHELVAQVADATPSASFVLVVEPVKPVPELAVLPADDELVHVIDLDDSTNPSVGTMPTPMPGQQVGALPDSVVGVLPDDAQIIVPGMLDPVTGQLMREEPVLDFDRLAKPSVSIDHGYDGDGHTQAAMNSGDVTDAMPHLMGYAPGYATVEVFDNDMLIGTSIADATGLWQFSPDALFVGEHVLVARAEGAPDSEPFHLTVVDHVGDLASLSMRDLFADEWVPMFADVSLDDVAVVTLDEAAAREAFETADAMVEFESYGNLYDVRGDFLPELEQHQM